MNHTSFLYFLAVGMLLLVFLHFVVDFLQDDDEADTVGCCTLKVGNVECIPPNKLKVWLLF